MALERLSHSKAQTRSSIIEELILNQATSDGVMKPSHSGIPQFKYALADGEPRCNPNLLGPVCSICWPNGCPENAPRAIQALFELRRQNR